MFSLDDRCRNTCSRADPAQPTALRVLPPGAFAQSAAQAFIHGVYSRTYDADVQLFAPTLVCLIQDGDIIAAAGYRHATEPLFLEQYLDEPIEALVGVDGPVDRTRIVEVGHLASVRPGASRRLIAALVEHLCAQGIEWVTSTVTADLRHLFIRLGVGGLALGSARPGPAGRGRRQLGPLLRSRPGGHGGSPADGRGSLASPSGSVNGKRPTPVR